MAAGALYQWLIDTASSRPRAPALTFLTPEGGAEMTYTYEHLFERVEELGAKLQTTYDDPTAPLGLLLRSQEDQALHYLAALSVGMVPAILTPPNRKINQTYYVETMREVLRRCRFGAIVSDVQGIDLSGRELAPYTFAGAKSPDPSRPESLQGGGALDASFMQFSSGTTGIKRGVLVNDDGVIAQLRTYGAALQLTEADCIVSWLPLYHDMGFIACLNMPLAYGVHTVMIDPIDWVSDPAIYLRAVSEYRGSLSWHPNFAFSFMARRVHEDAMNGTNLSSLRGLINCSEPVTHESQQSFLRRFESRGLAGDVFKGCYAMAETTFALTHGDSNDPFRLDHEGPADETRARAETAYVSVGRPLPGVELVIRDPEAQSEVSERVVGEVWVRSPFNFAGYYGDPEATSHALVGEWLRTGDLGYRVGEAFYIVGRLKDLLIVAGVNVFPQDIEDLVSQVDGVQPGRVSAFSAFDDRRQTEHVVVIAESDHHDNDSARALVQDIRQRILAAFQIANFEVRLVPKGWLVKSTSGKMARGANREKWLNGKGATVQTVGPPPQVSATAGERPAHD
ncbi:MAG: AMP-binding protein [Actinobacteria bacterium]|nr:AMP-binding protein [Actinomycetota bacterium]